MQSSALLSILRDEFALAAADVDNLLMQWLGEPDHAIDIVERLSAAWKRVAQATRVLSLEGLARIEEHMVRVAEQVAFGDSLAQLQGIEWLTGWNPLALAYLTDPTDQATLESMADYLQGGPLPLGLVEMSEIFSQLRAPIEMPADMLADEVVDTEFTAEDSSLALGEDVDMALLESFLDDAPAQTAAIAEAAQKLIEGSANPDSLVESQRVAHTLKGSGNIVGVRAVGKLAHGIEDIFEYALERGAKLPGPMASDLQQAIACLDQAISHLRGEDEAPTTIPAWLRRLSEWRVAALSGEAETSEFAPIEANFGSEVDVETGELVPAQAAKAAQTAEAAQADGASLRITAERMDVLLRRTSSSVVRNGRLREHLRTANDRLDARDVISNSLQQRLRELEQALDKQGLGFQERSAAGEDFDPLEMDRYNELQALVRFAAELVADEQELAAAVREQTNAALITVNDQFRDQTEQYQEMIALRLVPFKRVAARLRRTVLQTANVTAKQVRLELKGEQELIDSDILEKLTEPLLHLLRNAVDHGIETADERSLFGKPEEGVLAISITREGRQLKLVCADDGKGLDLSRIHAKAVDLGMIKADYEPSPAELKRMILQPGFTTSEFVTEVSGRGMGMDIVAERVRAIKGTLDIDSEPFVGTKFTLRIPVSMGAMLGITVMAGSELVAIASDRVVFGLAAEQGELHAVPDQRAHKFSFTYQDAVMPWYRLSDWLGYEDRTESGHATAPELMSVVIIEGTAGRFALAVNRIIDSRELILQNTPRLLQRLPGVAATCMREDGRVQFVINPLELELRALQAATRTAVQPIRRRAQIDRKRVLVVDDAVSVRKTLQQLLQDSGYDVATARDGFDALQQLAVRKPDIILTDLEMPNLNGIDLSRRVRASDELSSLPIIMITSRATDKHRERAVAAGVNAFLNKPYGDAELLGHIRAMTTL